jgi:hypothetical protein
VGDPEEELLKLNLCRCFLLDFIYCVDAQHEFIKPTRAELQILSSYLDRNLSSLAGSTNRYILGSYALT